VPSTTFFIGCYTKESGGAGDGIVRVRRDPVSGGLRSALTVGMTPSPSYLIRHPSRPVLYACNELDDGTVTAFGVSAGCELSPLGTWPTGGASPCYLSLDAGARHLLVANYGSGSVAVFRLDDRALPSSRSDLIVHSGRGPHPERQEAPHAHSVAPVEGGVLAVDLGIDTVFFYPLDPNTGLLGTGEVAFQSRPGTGPRHLARDPAGRLHLVGELDATVTTYAIGPNGWHEVSRVPTSVTAGALPSEIAVSADGRFLYVGNRVPDTISVFALAPAAAASGALPPASQSSASQEESPALTFVGEVSTGGIWPRHFVLDGGFLYVANERSHTVVTFRLDPDTGIPTPTADVLPTASPTCVLPW
jgi:6-phosphogluconolactonase (cycloisomerase 2 family)